MEAWRVCVLIVAFSGFRAPGVTRAPRRPAMSYVLNVAPLVSLYDAFQVVSRAGNCAISVKTCATPSALSASALLWPGAAGL